MVALKYINRKLKTISIIYRMIDMRGVSRI